MSARIESLELQAEMLKALAHPFRLRLLRELSREEECVCHLSALFERPQPYVSQQLAALREAGLVVDRRDAQRVYYRVASQEVAELLRAADRLVGLPQDPLTPRQSIAGCPCPKCG